MSISSVINVVGTIIIIIVGFYFANKVVKGSQSRERNMMVNGRPVELTIISMRQSGLFINNNPVLEMSLRIVDKKNNESWVVEKHKETAMLIALGDYNVENIYEGRLGKDKNDVMFVRDDSGKPVAAKP